MKIKNQQLVELLQLLGWTFVEDTEVTSYEIIDRYHKLSGVVDHDWHYGPHVRQSVHPATRLRRPQGISRSQERVLFKMALASCDFDRKGFGNLAERILRHAAIEVGTLVFLHELSLPGPQWGLAEDMDYRRRGDWEEGEIEPWNTKADPSCADEEAREAIDFLISDNGIDYVHSLVSIYRKGDTLFVNTALVLDEREYQVKRTR